MESSLGLDSFCFLQDLPAARLRRRVVALARAESTMIAPSPAPKPPRRRLWLRIAVGLLVTVLVLVGLAWWLVPPWIERQAIDSATTRLERLLGQPVALGEVKIDLPKVWVRDITVGSADDPLVRIDEVEVLFDEDALWSGYAVPLDARVRGGAVVGSREQVDEVVDAIRRRKPPQNPNKKARLQLVPRRVAVRDLVLDLWEGDREAPRRHVVGTLSANANPKTGDVGVSVSELRLEAGAARSVRAAEVRADLVLATTENGRALRFPMTVEVVGLGTAVTPQVAVAGVDGTITVSDAALSEITVSLEGGLSDRDDGNAAERLWSVAGRVRRDLGEGELKVSMESFELGKAPELLARLPLVQSEHATVGGRIALVFGSGLARAEGQVRLDGLNIAHRTLARQTVRDVGFDLDFAVEVDPIKPRVVVHHARVERRGVVLALEGEVEHPDEPSDRRYRLHAEIEPTPCDQVLQAIPAALVPSLQGFELGGEFDLNVDVEVDYADLEGLRLDGGVGIAGCSVEERPPRAAAERLSGGFTHRVTMRDGRLRSVHLYPGSSGFTPLPLISEHMVQAVLTTEDGGFWRHRGFLPSQFRTALQRNLEAGKIRLGASTITMQMVKNVLLSHERTLARKLQEMILTWYVETAVTKARIMEIYLNIVELGPGIYGVSRAADHYFGKHPSELTPPEAVYLSLMLPSPVRRHAQYCRGTPSDSFMVKVGRILRIMNERGRLSDLDYEVWKDEPIVFDLRERGDTGPCLGEIEVLMAGRETQRALSGLLASSGDPDWETDLPAPSNALDEDDPADADAPGSPAMDEGVD